MQPQATNAIPAEPNELRASRIDRVHNAKQRHPRRKQLVAEPQVLLVDACQEPHEAVPTSQRDDGWRLGHRHPSASKGDNVDGVPGAVLRSVVLESDGEDEADVERDRGEDEEDLEGVLEAARPARPQREEDNRVHLSRPRRPVSQRLVRLLLLAQLLHLQRIELLEDQPPCPVPPRDNPCDVSDGQECDYGDDDVLVGERE